MLGSRLDRDPLTPIPLRGVIMMFTLGNGLEKAEAMADPEGFADTFVFLYRQIHDQLLEEVSGLSEQALSWVPGPDTTRQVFGRIGHRPLTNRGSCRGSGSTSSRRPRSGRCAVLPVPRGRAGTRPREAVAARRSARGRPSPR